MTWETHPASGDMSGVLNCLKPYYQMPMESYQYVECTHHLYSVLQAYIFHRAKEDRMSILDISKWMLALVAMWVALHRNQWDSLLKVESLLFVLCVPMVVLYTSRVGLLAQPRSIDSLKMALKHGRDFKAARNGGKCPDHSHQRCYCVKFPYQSRPWIGPMWSTTMKDSISALWRRAVFLQLSLEKLVC